MTRRRYWVYGCSISSELPLPELEGESWYRDGRVNGPGHSGASSTEEIDIEVVVGEVPLPHGAPNTQYWYHVSAEGSVLFVAPGTRFLVTGGRKIVAHMDSATDEGAVRLYLLGTALAIALHQRGDIPLHAGVVVVKDRAWALAAPSGVGKSTLVASLHFHAGLPLLGDDVAVARGNPVTGYAVFGGPPLIKLDDASLQVIGSRSVEKMPEYAGSAKHRVRSVGSYLAGPIPLAGVVLLRREPSARATGLILQRVSGGEALEVAAAALHRGELARSLVPPVALFGRLSALASGVRMYAGALVPHELVGAATRARLVQLALERENTSPPA